MAHLVLITIQCFLFFLVAWACYKRKTVTVQMHSHSLTVLFKDLLEYAEQRVLCRLRFKQVILSSCYCFSLCRFVICWTCWEVLRRSWSPAQQQEAQHLACPPAQRALREETSWICWEGWSLRPSHQVWSFAFLHRWHHLESWVCTVVTGRWSRGIVFSPIIPPLNCEQGSTASQQKWTLDHTSVWEELPKMTETITKFDFGSCTICWHLGGGI